MSEAAQELAALAVEASTCTKCALAETRTPHMFRMQPGYDHSYFFVASFMEDHIRWHAERLAE